MQPEEEQLRKLSRRYFRLAIVSLFLMAFLRGLGPFFFSLFFWPALGLGILGLYYQWVARKEEQVKTAQWHQPDYESPSGSKNKRLVLIVIVSALSLLVIISALISSKKSSDTSSTNESTQTEEAESQPEETKSSAYDNALKEYNNQNYRLSISIARKALISDPNSNDLMLVLGDDYGALKQNDSSFIWFDRAYQNGARNADLSHWLGYLHDDKGNIAEGIRFYKDALKQDSTRTQIYDRLAVLEPEKAEWYKKKSALWAEK
jgi:hypothetical protein